MTWRVRSELVKLCNVAWNVASISILCRYFHSKCSIYHESSNKVVICSQRFIRGERVEKDSSPTGQLHRRYATNTIWFEFVKVGHDKRSQREKLVWDCQKEKESLRSEQYNVCLYEKLEKDLFVCVFEFRVNEFVFTCMAVRTKALKVKPTIQTNIILHKRFMLHVGEEIEAGTTSANLCSTKKKKKRMNTKRCEH